MRRLGGGTLQVDGHHASGQLIHNEGLSLHRAGDDFWQPENTFPSSIHQSECQRSLSALAPEKLDYLRAVRRLEKEGAELRCRDVVFFPYLDTVGPADGGLVVLCAPRIPLPDRRSRWPFARLCGAKAQRLLTQNCALQPGLT